MARLEIAVSDGRIASVTVRLSRRNIEALRHKLDFPGSQRRIVNNDCWINGEQAPGTLELHLVAEDDYEHYGRRPAPPGQMHPETERFIAAAGGWSRGGEG